MTMVSDCMRSNLYTMGITSKLDPRQGIPSTRRIPPADTRKLRARLILEEALETCAALGVKVFVGKGESIYDIDGVDDVRLDVDPHFHDCRSDDELDRKLEAIVDGCCDTIYVATGTMAACGVPDLPHLAEVNRANNAKFPGGAAITDASGKFQKPEGWQPPRHVPIMRNPLSQVDLRAHSIDLIGASVRTSAAGVNATMAAQPRDLLFMLRTAHVNMTDDEVAALSSDQRVAALRWVNAYLNAAAHDRPAMVNGRPDFMPAPSC